MSSIVDKNLTSRNKHTDWLPLKSSLVFAVQSATHVKRCFVHLCRKCRISLNPFRLQ
jgi:hypothetical protein